MSANAVQLYSQFKGELDKRADKIAELLPPNISRERFLHYARIAVSNQPKLLLCHRVSLHNAIMKAATDKLVPDGREGVIIPRDEKGGSTTATWQPMAHGIRKRAAEYGIIIDAKVVCENDLFEWEEGLNPILRHVPTSLKEDPGELIGAYAVFRRDGKVLHFEVMRKGQILKVRSISRQPNGLMWKEFTDQAWIKTVVRRASKSVPEMPEPLQQVIERQDDDFAFAGARDRLDMEDDNRDPLADGPGTPAVDPDGPAVDLAAEDYSQETPLDPDASPVTNGTGAQAQAPDSRAERGARGRERRPA